MNTRIRNGFLVEGVGIHRLYNLMTQFGESAKSHILHLGNQWLARRATEIHDLRCVGLEQTPERNSPMMSAYLEMIDRHKKMRSEGARDPEVDWSFEVNISPSSDDRFMGIFHTEQDTLVEMFLAQDWVQEYTYFDPECHAAESAARETAAVRAVEWNKFFASSFKPSVAAFTFTCASNSDIYPRADLVDELTPSHEFRCEQTAKVSIVQDRVGDIEDVQGLMAVLDTYESMEEGSLAAEVVALTKVMSSLLPTNLSYETLSHPVRREMAMSARTSRMERIISA